MKCTVPSVNKLKGKSPKGPTFEDRVIEWLNNSVKDDIIVTAADNEGNYESLESKTPIPMFALNDIGRFKIIIKQQLEPLGYVVDVVNSWECDDPMCVVTWEVK